VGLGLLIDAESRPSHFVAQKDPAAYRIYAPGRIEGTTPDIELRCQLAGRIVEVLVHEGDLVEVGQVLLRLDDEQYQHELALAQAELDAAKAQKDRLLNGARVEERSEADALYRASLAELEQAENKWER